MSKIECPSYERTGRTQYFFHLARLAWKEMLPEFNEVVLMWDGKKRKVSCSTRTDTLEWHIKLSLQKNLASAGRAVVLLPGMGSFRAV